MEEERLACRTPGCQRTIQPATAARNEGYCGPCSASRQAAQQEEEARRKELYFRAHPHEANEFALFEKATDPVEVIKIALELQSDPWVRHVPPPRSMPDLFHALSLQVAGKMMQVAARALRAGQLNLADDVARSMAVYTDFNLDEMLRAWLNARRYEPAVAFRSASAAVRDQVLAVLRSRHRVLRMVGLEPVDAEKALQALAWIGDDTVVEAFKVFDQSPPIWKSLRLLPVSAHTRAAGWEVLDGVRRDLVLDRCFSISPAWDEPASQTVHIAEETADSCQWCGSALVNLLRIDAADPLFEVLGTEGKCLEFKTCTRCAGLGDIFAELDSDGRGHWSRANKRPKLVPEHPQRWGRHPWSGVPVTLKPRRPLESADACLATPLSQIGGLPAWFQSVNYPYCCNCRKSMIFVCQIDNGQFPQYQGMHYGFICRECRVTATTSQQYTPRPRPSPGSTRETVLFTS